MIFLEELRKGNVQFLSKLLWNDKRHIVELIGNANDCDTILRTILPIFRSTNNWYGMSNYIFELII